MRPLLHPLPSLPSGPSRPRPAGRCPGDDGRGRRPVGARAVPRRRGPPGRTPSLCRPRRPRAARRAVRLFRRGIAGGRRPPAAPPALDRWLDVVLRFPSVVAWHGTDAVGQVFLAPDGDGHELSVFIDPAYHHAGVGGRLVDAALALAAARGGGRVGVLTRGDNRPMLALALAHGFVVTGTADGQVELARDVPAAE
ncbi:GNAT family N-acetyltransferase [Halosegnis marinus]|uniref:GNAT family N-acetyltransferase n=1 Tax=Halosegnis marinus TaxID=3034023 RepID=UPI0036073ED7